MGCNNTLKERTSLWDAILTLGPTHITLKQLHNQSMTFKHRATNTQAHLKKGEDQVVAGCEIGRPHGSHVQAVAHLKALHCAEGCAALHLEGQVVGDSFLESLTDNKIFCMFVCKFIYRHECGIECHVKGAKFCPLSQI